MYVYILTQNKFNVHTWMYVHDYWQRFNAVLEEAKRSRQEQRMSHRREKADDQPRLLAFFSALT